MQTELLTMASSINDFYRDKNIFITGGTGFLGSCLIEKLLRCCVGIKNIYVLIRPKKGKDVKERLEELTKNSVFDRLRDEAKTDLFKKLIAIAGDVGEDNLGLSAEDRFTLAEEIHVVFHSAASLDFDASLKSNVNINLLGTRKVMQLGHEIRNLKALVHVSSAYVTSYQLEAKEQIYPAPANVKELLEKYENLDADAFEKAAPSFIKNHPNAYTFTKHLAEHEVVNSGLPAAIVRPSMITAAWKEPMPGWTTSKNGPQGFLMGASKGVVRRLPVNINLIYDYIPIDVVVNSLIAASYSVNSDSEKNLKVYHCTSSTTNPFRWSIVLSKVNHNLQEYPLQSAVWYPHLRFLPSLWLFRISAIFFHIIPAYILDTVTRVAGGRPILVRMHNNVNSSLERLEKFIFTEWTFHSPRLVAMNKSLENDDKETFNLDITELDWDDYFINLTKGVRVYLSKENLRNLDKARRKAKFLLVAHLGLQAAFLTLVWWIFKIIVGSTWTKTGMIVPIVYFLYTLL